MEHKRNEGYVIVSNGSYAQTFLFSLWNLDIVEHLELNMPEIFATGQFRHQQQIKHANLYLWKMHAFGGAVDIYFFLCSN